MFYQVLGNFLSEVDGVAKEVQVILHLKCLQYYKINGKCHNHGED